MTNFIDDATMETVAALGELLRERGMGLAAAESCTGGLLAAALTSVPGSSEWFVGSLVTYQLKAKTALLDVPDDLLQNEGAVNRRVAELMAAGALARTGADISVATTGLAGPEGDGTDVPVGTLWIAWASRDPAWVTANRYELHEPRNDFRLDAVDAALSGLLGYLENPPV